MENTEFKPIVCISMVALNVILYILCLFEVGDIYGWGILGAAEVVDKGEYYRILSAAFLHGSSAHLVNNIIILLFLGQMIEQVLGHVNYGVLYFGSAIGGNILSLLSKIARGSDAGSLGASGVAFGLDGALLALLLFSEIRLQRTSVARVILVIALSLYSGFSATNIDNMAHLGGLITGFVITIIICIFRRKKRMNF